MTDRTTARALGKAISIRRIELGLSRNDLRDRSGLSYPYVAELEKGAKRPSSRSLDALAEALELRPFELLARAESLSEEAPDAMDAVSSLPDAMEAAPSTTGRWFGPVSDGMSTSTPTRWAAPSAPLTEARVREIVREELRRLLAGAGD